MVDFANESVTVGDVYDGPPVSKYMAPAPSGDRPASVASVYEEPPATPPDALAETRVWEPAISRRLVGRVRHAVNQLRRRMDRRRSRDLQACESLLATATVTMAELWEKSGECAGRERAINEVLGLLEPLRDSESFGGATAAFHNLAEKILSEKKSQAYRAGVSVRNEPCLSG